MTFDRSTSAPWDHGAVPPPAGDGGPPRAPSPLSGPWPWLFGCGCVLLLACLISAALLWPSFARYVIRSDLHEWEDVLLRGLGDDEDAARARERVRAGVARLGELNERGAISFFRHVDLDQSFDRAMEDGRIDARERELLLERMEALAREVEAEAGAR